MAEQLAFNLPGSGFDLPSPEPAAPAEAPDLDSYSRIIVAFSGGKDSVACVLHLLDLGMRDQLELWHHDVDGREGGRLMD